MRLLIFIFILILSISVVEARIYRPTAREQIRTQAFLLKADTLNETIINIMEFAESNITYEFHWSIQSIEDIWKSRKGDCTDQATLMKYMLETVYYRNNTIRFTIVHGLCDGMKHDWLRIGKQDIDNFYCYERQYRGIGTW